MAIRVSYGGSANVNAAINSGIIPKDSIIITNDDPSSAELMFYDKDAVLARIVAKQKFNNADEAVEYARANSQAGTVITVLSGGRYTAYVVQPDFSLAPMGAGDVPIATNTTAGLVKGNDGENGVGVGDDGSMFVNSVNITKLVQSDGDEIIFNCGSATD